jgi:4-amino-4-deoxy-L-arabinose transferase-like glycosyltransferase
VWFDLQVRGERLGEASAPLVVILFTFLLGDRLFTPSAGLWAALILLTSYDFFVHSQQVLPDMRWSPS